MFWELGLDFMPNWFKISVGISFFVGPLVIFIFVFSAFACAD